MFISTDNNTVSYCLQYANVFAIKHTLPYASTMGNLKQNLEQAMARLGLNPTSLSEVSGVPQPTIQRFLKGTHGDPRTATIQKLAKGLHMTEAQLRGITGNTESISYIQGKVPLISRIQAGMWCESVDNFHPGDAEDWLPCPEKHSEKTYALRVVGDSMTSPYPGQRSYPENTIIYVDPEKQIVNGCRVVAKLPDSDEATFKEYREESGKRYLKPINPTYDKIEITEGVRICGVVIGQYLSE